MGTFIEFFVLGSIFLIIGIGFLINRIAFIKQSKIIEGKIISIRIDYEDNMKSYFPDIEYLDDRNKRCIFKSNTGYRASKHKVNDLIELRYCKVGKNNRVCENNFFALYSISLLFIPIGLLFSVIGALNLFF